MSMNDPLDPLERDAFIERVRSYPYYSFVHRPTRRERFVAWLTNDPEWTIQVIVAIAIVAFAAILWWPR